jgi:hypothetical protein
MPVLERLPQPYVSASVGQPPRIVGKEETYIDPAQASPGAALLVDLAAEYNATRHWVLVMEGVYRHQYSTHVAGYSVASPNLPILLNSGSGQVFGLAPAIEYNFNSRVGLILGLRLFPAGKNATHSITPAMAVNIVH